MGAAVETVERGGSAVVATVVIDASTTNDRNEISSPTPGADASAAFTGDTWVTTTTSTSAPIRPASAIPTCA